MRNPRFKQMSATIDTLDLIYPARVMHGLVEPSAPSERITPTGITTLTPEQEDIR